LTDQFGWRSAFFINLPVGLVALAISLRVIPHDVPHARQSTGSIGNQERFDLPGALAFMAGLIALLLGLNQAHAWGWLSLPILGLLAIAVIFLMVFLWIEKRAFSPMLDLQLFTNRMFSASIVSAILNYICVYSILFLLPFYLIQGRQFSPSQAGLVLTSMPIIMALVAPISGHLSDIIGPRLPGMTGMGLLTVALLFLSRLAANTPLWQVALYLALAGLGIGIFISPNNSALMGSAPHHRQGIAAGVLATARSVGMVLGIGIAGAIFTSVLAMWPGDSVSGIFPAVQTAFLNLSSAALLGVIVSAVRGNGGR
jgi:MFS family permease